MFSETQSKSKKALGFQPYVKINDKTLFNDSNLALKDFKPFDIKI
jgi:hypothetical protein